MIDNQNDTDPEKVRSDLISLKQLYGLLLHRPRETDSSSPIHLDDPAWIMLKDLLNDATRRLLEKYSQMAAASQSNSSLATKVFSMSVEEENSRKKLQRIDSPDISSAVPVLAPNFSKPASNVFAFTATKNELLSGAGSTARARCEHSKPPIEAGRYDNGGMRCWVCKRLKVTKATSRTGYEPLSGKQWPPSRDNDDGNQVNSFSISSINFTQSEPNSLLFKFADSVANSKSKEGLQPKCSASTAESTAVACHNSVTRPAMPSQYENYAGNKLEDTDQIVKGASEMVKLLESRITALQQSTQALKPPSEINIAMGAPPINSSSASKKEESLNQFLHAKHKLMETSMPRKPPLDQSSRVADKSSQQSPNFLNLSPPVITFSSEASSPAPSLSSTPSGRQSAAPSQSHKSSQWQRLAPSNQILMPSPKQISVKSQNLSSIPNQKSRPSLNVNNTVQKLESLRVSSCPYHATPKYINGFIVSPARTHIKLEKDNMHRAPTAHAGSTSSGVSRPSKPSNTPTQTRILESTQEARNPTSKLMRSHKILSRPQSLSDYNHEYVSSVSSSSSSWTTTQQSGPMESAEYSFSSSGSLTRRTESSITPSYSTEATSSSEMCQSSQRRPSRAPSFNRRRHKERGSPKEKPISRLRRIKNKLGLIFHHHHHHHHHHHDVEKPKSMWKNMRQKMVHEQAAKKASESAVKSSVMVEKRKSQKGHFHALLDGLMRHVRFKKKKKKKLKEIGRRKKKVKWRKHRRRLKLPVSNKKTNFKAVRKLKA